MARNIRQMGWFYQNDFLGQRAWLAVERIKHCEAYVRIQCGREVVKNEQGLRAAGLWAEREEVLKREYLQAVT